MTTLQSLVVVLGLDTRPLTAGAAKAEASMAGLGASAAKGLGAIPLGATAAGLAVGAFAASSVKAAIDTDQAFTRIAAVSNASQEQIAGWRDSVMDLAGETAMAPKELADALFFLASSGLDAKDVFPALEMSAKAAASGLGDVTDVAQITSSVLNAYAGSGITAADATDVLVAAVREGKAEPTEFAQALGRILPIAAAAGVSFDEVAASMAVLSNIGLDVNEGVTAMRGLLNALEAPGSQAAQTLAEVGLSADEVRKVISEDGVVAALDMLMKATGGNLDTLRKIVPNIRALTGALGISGQEADKVQTIYDNVKDSTGDMGAAFEETSKGGAFQIKQALNEIQIAGQKLAENLLPVLANLLKLLADIANYLTMPLETPEVGKANADQLEAYRARLQEYQDQLEKVAVAEAAGAITHATAAEAVKQIAGAYDQALPSTKEWYAQHLNVADGLSAEQSAAESAADSAQHLKAGTEAVTASTEQEAAAHHHAAEAMDEQARAQLELAGGMLGIVASADSLQDAQKAVNDLQKKGKQGTEEYRDASLDLLTKTEELKAKLADYAVELDKQGASGKTVIGTIKDMGKEMGLTGGDVRDLLGDVESLTGDLGKLGKQHPKPSVSLEDNATPTIVSLEDRLNQLTAHDWELRIHASTSGGSTAFDLLDHLEQALHHVVDQDWEVVIHASGPNVGDQIHAFLHDFNDLERAVARIRSNMESFRDAIKSGFSGFTDLVGLLSDALDEYTQAQAAALEAGTEMPQAPDLHALLTEQVAQTQAFADLLTKLQEAGLSRANLQQIAAAGPSAMGLGQALLSDPTLIQQMNAAQQQIADIIEDSTKTLVEGAFGGQLDKLGDRFDRLEQRLEQFVDSIPVPEMKDATEEFIRALRHISGVLDNLEGNGNNGGGHGGHPRSHDDDELASAIAREIGKLPPRDVPVVGFEAGVLNVIQRAGLGRSSR